MLMVRGDGDGPHRRMYSLVGAKATGEHLPVLVAGILEQLRVSNFAVLLEDQGECLLDQS